MKIPESFKQPIEVAFPRLSLIGNWIGRILTLLILVLCVRILFSTFVCPDNPDFWADARHHISYLGAKVAFLVGLMAMGVGIIVRESRQHGFLAMYGTVIVLVVTLSLATLDPQHKNLSKLSDQFHMQLLRATLGLFVYLSLMALQRMRSDVTT